MSLLLLLLLVVLVVLVVRAGSCGWMLQRRVR
jgi:hypothetical protein